MSDIYHIIRERVVDNMTLAPFEIRIDLFDVFLCNGEIKNRPLLTLPTFKIYNIP